MKVTLMLVTGTESCNGDIADAVSKELFFGKAIVVLQGATNKVVTLEMCKKLGVEADDLYATALESLKEEAEVKGILCMNDPVSGAPCMHENPMDFPYEEGMNRTFVMGGDAEHDRVSYAILPETFEKLAYFLGNEFGFRFYGDCFEAASGSELLLKRYPYRFKNGSFCRTEEGGCE